MKQFKEVNGKKITEVIIEDIKISIDDLDDFAGDNMDAIISYLNCEGIINTSVNAWSIENVDTDYLITTLNYNEEFKDRIKQYYVILV